MKTVRDNRKKITTKSFNRRISVLLAFILLFQAVFGGVEVRAGEVEPDGQSAASQSAEASQPGTSPVSYPEGDYTLTINRSGAWGGYAQYSITITNTSDTVLGDIALALPWQDAEVDAVWSATAEKHQDTIYILPLEWCENLAPGVSLSLGIIIKGDDDKLLLPEKHTWQKKPGTMSAPTSLPPCATSLKKEHPVQKQ